MSPHPIQAKVLLTVRQSAIIQAPPGPMGLLCKLHVDGEMKTSEQANVEE